VTLPPNIPARAFWSLTLYDNQPRSAARYPAALSRAGSQTYPSPTAQPNADGSTTVYFGPTQPAGVARGNWIQTMPQGLVHDPAPLQPAATVLRQDLAAERDRTGRVKVWLEPADNGVRSGCYRLPRKKIREIVSLCRLISRSGHRSLWRRDPCVAAPAVGR
jgi:hypothetical protein